jgi:prevent-host-death family protein
MGFSVRDIVPLTQARANLSELADEARGGADKIITKNGESYVALISADKLAYFQQLERERFHLLLLEDARQAFEEIAAGRTFDAQVMIDELRREHTGKSPR